MFVILSTIDNGPGANMQQRTRTDRYRHDASDRVDTGPVLAHYSIYLQGQHHSDVTWALTRLKSPTIKQLIQQLVQADDKEIINAPHYWAFVRGYAPIKISTTKNQ